MKPIHPTARILSLLLPLFFSMHGQQASAQNPKPAQATQTNYVVFNLTGDCGQDDCIAAAKGALQELQPDIASVSLESLAPHPTIEYKKVIISFKDLKNAPYPQVIAKFTELGYKLVSYIVHDTHTGKDVIVLHQ